MSRPARRGGDPVKGYVALLQFAQTTMKVSSKALAPGCGTASKNVGGGQYRSGYPTVKLEGSLPAATDEKKLRTSRSVPGWVWLYSGAGDGPLDTSKTGAEPATRNMATAPACG